MAGPLHIQPMQWTRVSDLGDVPPLDEADLACLLELRDVLLRHGRLERFALHLVHRHFALGAHEVLVETCDPALREQRLRVRRRDSVALRGAVPTTWLLVEDAPHPLATCVCAVRDGQGHLGRHRSR